jgi:hypothetical protein
MTSPVPARPARPSCRTTTASVTSLDGFHAARCGPMGIQIAAGGEVRVQHAFEEGEDPGQPG